MLAQDLQNAVERIERRVDQIYREVISIATLVGVLVAGRNVESENMAQAAAAFEEAAGNDEEAPPAVAGFTNRVEEVYGDAWQPPQTTEETAP